MITPKALYYCNVCSAHLVPPLSWRSPFSSSSSSRFSLSLDFMKGNFRLKEIFCPPLPPAARLPPAPTDRLPLTDRSRLVELRLP